MEKVNRGFNMDRSEKTKSYDIVHINEARRMSGLKEIQPKNRICLRCERKFVSQGEHNRLCDFCRKINVKDHL